MSQGLPKETRRALFANKFAFENDEEILINAINLVHELAKKDYLEAENKKLKERIAWLETITKPVEPQYRRFDITI